MMNREQAFATAFLEVYRKETGPITYAWKNTSVKYSWRISNRAWWKLVKIAAGTSLDKYGEGI